MKSAARHAVVGVCAALLAPFAAAQYQVAAVADGGTIKGKVIFKGTVPMKTVLPTKDKETCGGPRKDPLVIVGAGGEVKDVVVQLKEVKSGKAWTAPAKPAAIDNKGCDFHPHVQVIAGGNFDIVNSDPVLHNTHGYYGKNTAFNVALPLQDGKVTRPLRRPGVVRVDCDAHGWMEGWVVVADSPYYAQTGADGSFTISDVPPGTYTMVVWQEHTGEVEMPVTVKAKETVNVATIELKK
jgi:Carboxypeptidase regulatory-like domain